MTAALPVPPGPYPDAHLRGRVAAALLARIKQAVIERTAPLSGQIGSIFAATEYDLADVTLAELAPELDRAARAEQAETALAEEKQRQERYEEEIVGRFNAQATDLARRAGQAEQALAEILDAVRTFTDADTGERIHIPGHITPEQYQRWQQLAHGQEPTS